MRKLSEAKLRKMKGTDGIIDSMVDEILGWRASRSCDSVLQRAARVVGVKMVNVRSGGKCTERLTVTRWLAAYWMVDRLGYKVSVASRSIGRNYSTTVIALSRMRYYVSAVGKDGDNVRRLIGLMEGSVGKKQRPH